MKQLTFAPGRCFLLHRQPDPSWSAGRRTVWALWRAALLLCAALCLGAALLVLAYGPYSREVLWDYLSSGTILWLNSLPVAVLALLLYGLTGRCWLAFFLSGLPAVGLSLGNYYKLVFRDDPLYLEDLWNLREAGAMASGDHYALFVNRRILLVVLCWLLGTLALALLAGGVLRGWKKRLPPVLAALLAGVLVWNACQDTARYTAVENYAHLRRWSTTQAYLSRGFLYPFLHSASALTDTPPEGYSEKEAAALLAEYTDADIPADRQVNVIAVMREAYVDFSRYGIPGMDTRAYDLYHSLREESYSGDLLVNIFAGGTVDSERCFLTGDWRLKNFRTASNSYLWYLRQQGYTVEGSHPYYQWFYNRRNVNGYLGFERYRFLEGDYEMLSSAAMPPDSILYPEVYADFVANKASGKPYFSFVLTVESHGPYGTGSYGGAFEYLTGDYSDACKNAVNNYRAILHHADQALLELVEQLRTDPDPVVLLVYSDHLPWMGDGNCFYDELGLELDTGTESGFRNYYTTEYLIWANDAAKAVLGNDFSGQGPTVSPCYLMNLLFEQCGWEGPAYMQAMDELRQVFPVVTTNGGYVVDDAFVKEIPQARQELFRQFEQLQYYWRSRFLYRD